MRICIDTCVLVWGIRREASPGQEHMIPRTVHLLDKLQKVGAEILVPAPVLMEALLGVSEDRHQRFVAGLGRQFIIVPFDARAAAEAATLWLKANAGRSVSDAVRLATKGSRHEIRCDFMILGIAAARGVSVLYTDDSGLQNLASMSGVVKACGIPEAEAQLSFDGLGAP